MRPIFSLVIFSLLIFISSPHVRAEETLIRLWSRADRSGPLRAGNIVAAARLLNKSLADSGSKRNIDIRVHESTAKGYDDDALDLLKAFAVGKGPDLYVAAHEWIATFAEAGYAWNLEKHIASYPEYYSDVIPILWDACRFKGVRYCVPQDTEVLYWSSEFIGLNSYLFQS